MLALYVLFQRLATNVAAVTELARERALVGVRLLVLQQVAFQREALVTQLAHVWFLAAVRQQVIL